MLENKIKNVVILNRLLCYTFLNIENSIEKWAWILVRNIFYKPYFMLYGEVYAGEIDTCGDEGQPRNFFNNLLINIVLGTNCVPGW